MNILSKATLNIQESRKSIKSLKRSQDLIKKSKSFVSCYHMNCYLQKLYYTSFYIFYILCILRQVQKSKNYENPTSTSKATSKTIFIILFNWFCICNSSEFKVTHEVQLI